MERKINQKKIGIILSYVNILIGSIIPIVYTPIMLKLLGQAEYGIYSLSQSVTSYLSLLNFGIGSAIMRYVIKYKVEKDKKSIESLIGLFLIIYLFLGLLVCLAGILLVFNIDNFFSNGLSVFEIKKLKFLIAIMTFNTFLTFITSVFTSVTMAFEKYITRYCLDILSTILIPILNIFVLYHGYGSNGMVINGLFIQIVILLIYNYYLTKRVKIHFNFKSMPLYLLKELLTFSFFIFISTLADLLFWATDKILIGATLGSISVAIYNVGGTFTNMLQTFTSAISNVFSPQVNTLVFQKKDISENTNLLIKVGRIQYLIVSLIISGFIVFGHQFLYFWAGEGYQESYYIALVTMIPLSIPLIQNIAYTTTTALNKHKTRSIIYVCIAILNVISTYLVIPYFGIISAAICTGVSYIIGNGIILNYYYYKVIGLDIPLFWKNIIKMSIIPIIMAIFGYIVINYYIVNMSAVIFLECIFLYTIFFVVLSWLFTMNKYEKNLIISMLKKLKFR